MIRTSFFTYLAAIGLWSTLGCVNAAARGEDATFARTIQPILNTKCGKCHSDVVQKGDLNLSTALGIRRGGESGESAIGPTLDESPLWVLIESNEMPPEGLPRLSDSEREAIRRWILSGADEEIAKADASEPLTQHDVLPIVLLRCAPCHGRARQDGGLDLRTVSSMLHGGNSGPALVPGDPDTSRMIDRIESQACPPRDLLLKFFVKRPPETEVAKLRQWIAEGAREWDIPPDVATNQPDPLVSDEDRSHWAFQPPRRTTGYDRIDDFLRAKLREQGLDFSPIASRDVLIRRAYLDLIGMPPSVEQWQLWRSCQDSDWYSQMIDALLASPGYGERWGRYWLDLAGYADSEGGVSADPVRQVAWKYRDYVIRSFNEDKPYDQFLIQQIAGDELVDYERAAEITEPMVENLIATGFLRMGIDQTGSRTMNFVPERLGVISDVITIVGEGLMGMTMGCARCHSHKYDPIPQRDYYRLKAVFQGALDEHDWLTFKNRTLNIDTPERRERVAQRNPPLQSRLKQLGQQLKQAETDLRLELLRQHYPDQSEQDRNETIAALRIADNNRTLPQRILVEKLQQVEVLPESEQPPSVVAARSEVRRINREIIDCTREMEPPLTIRGLWDRGQPSPTYVLRRGEHNQPGRLVGPGVPSVLTDGKTPFVVEPPFDGKTGRRLAFANWLTHPDHPLTSRVMVNRIWYHHFGSGLVATLENFGVQGERPSHPELLDWLALEFVSRGWSIKAMHRLIMHSHAYRQSSLISEDRQAADPQNRLLSRMPLRRMNAEAVRDSLLFVAGRLASSPGGPPDPVTVDQDGLVSVLATPSGQWRRSVYVQTRRTEIPTMLETFDYPEMGPNCLMRAVSNNAPQSLLLMNNGQVRELAASVAQRVRDRVGDPASDASIVNTVYHLVLSRPASDRERQLGIESLQRMARQWADHPERALETYCHAMLNSAGFLYVD